jgi:hypothetical protein
MLIIAGHFDEGLWLVGHRLRRKVHQGFVTSGDHRGDPVDTDEAPQGPLSGREPIDVGDAGLGLESPFRRRGQPVDGHSVRGSIVLRDQYENPIGEGLSYNANLGVAGDFG